jgi:hypothetical protein
MRKNSGVIIICGASCLGKEEEEEEKKKSNKQAEGNGKARKTGETRKQKSETTLLHI